MSRHATFECVDIANLLQPFVDDELTDGEREPVLEHLHDCPVCSATVREQQQVRAVLRNLGLTPASNRLRINVLRALDAVDLERSEAEAPAERSSEGSKVASDGAPIRREPVANTLATDAIDGVVAITPLPWSGEQPVSASPSTVWPRRTQPGSTTRRGWGQSMRRVGTWLAPAMAAGLAVIALNQQLMSGTTSVAQLSAAQDRSSAALSEGTQGVKAPHTGQPAHASAPAEPAAQVESNEVAHYPFSPNAGIEPAKSQCDHNSAPELRAQAQPTGKDESAKPSRANDSRRPHPRANDRGAKSTEMARDDQAPPLPPRRMRKDGDLRQWASHNDLPNGIAFESAGPSVTYYRELSLSLQVVDRHQPADQSDPIGRLFQTSHGTFFLSRDSEGRARVQFVQDDVFHELMLPDQQPAAFDLPIDPNRSDFRHLIELGGAIRRAAAAHDFP